MWRNEGAGKKMREGWGCVGGKEEGGWTCGLEENGKGFGWIKRVVVEKIGQWVMCLYKTTLFYTYKYSYLS